MHIERIHAHLDALAQIRDTQYRGVTRRAFTSVYDQGRAWLATQMRQAGLAVHIDSGGNLVGRLAGRDATCAPIVLGSHTDTVMEGGKYDGALGVLTALEVAMSIRERHGALRHPIEVVDFLAEESTPLGSLVGSTAMVQGLPATLLDLEVPMWGTLRQAITQVGGVPEMLVQPLRTSADVAAYLEVHIEQGPVLEAQNVPIAAVSGIVGIRRADIVFVGRADHAGTASMALRHDALAAAAQLIVQAELIAQSMPGCVATVGALDIAPNQSNVIPSLVRLSVEMRSMEWSEVESMWAHLEQVVHSACNQRGVTFQIQTIHDSLPVRFAPVMIDTLADACMQVAGQRVIIPSGAGHDGSMLGLIAPAGMIFVRTKDGRSHCPEEYAHPDDIAQGAQALYAAVCVLDETLP